MQDWKLPHIPLKHIKTRISRCMLWYNRRETLTSVDTGRQTWVRNICKELLSIFRSIVGYFNGSSIHQWIIMLAVTPMHEFSRFHLYFLYNYVVHTRGAGQRNAGITTVKDHVPISRSHFLVCFYLDLCVQHHTGSDSGNISPQNLFLVNVKSNWNKIIRNISKYTNIFYIYFICN